MILSGRKLRPCSRNHELCLGGSMIIDQIKHVNRYNKTHENIRTALEFIAKHADGGDIEDGTASPALQYLG